MNILYNSLEVSCITQCVEVWGNTYSKIYDPYTYHKNEKSQINCI